jgi:hypothetical protein
MILIFLIGPFSIYEMIIVYYYYISSYDGPFRSCLYHKPEKLRLLKKNQEYFKKDLS